MTKKLTVYLAVMLLAMSVTGIAHAHTTSIGFVPGANPGEVTFWTGSYHSLGGAVNEGTLTLAGVLPTVFGPVTTPFNIPPTGVMPAGLIDGTNNFYWGGPSGAGATFPHPSDQGVGGGVEIWQGVTFNGLNPGNYSFTCGATCGTSVVWASWGAGVGNLALTSGDIGGGGTNGQANPIPEPASMLLLGGGLIGAFVKRNRKNA